MLPLQLHQLAVSSIGLGDISYCIQVLHHSATTEIKWVLFVDASLKSIIYSCIVSFSESDLSHYKKHTTND
jgi:hypothetical protein